MQFANLLLLESIKFKLLHSIKISFLHFSTLLHHSLICSALQLFLDYRPVHLRKYIFLNTIFPIRNFTQLTRKLSKMYSRYFASNPNVNFVFAYRKVIFIITQPMWKLPDILTQIQSIFQWKSPKYHIIRGKSFVNNSVMKKIGQHFS